MVEMEGAMPLENAYYDSNGSLILSNGEVQRLLPAADPSAPLPITRHVVTSVG